MMKPIAVNQLSDNFFETISKEWMLVTAGNKDAFNTMTANWGGIGFLWNKPVVYVFIRPERYTFGFMEKNDYFTLEPNNILYLSDYQIIHSILVVI